MRSQDFYFDDATMRTMIKVFHCRTNDRVFIENSERIVHSLFDYMRQEPYFPSKDLADEIGRWFKTKRHEKWRSGYAGLDENGICGICGKQLDPLTLTDNEFKQLHDQIMEKVIKSKDVYLKTSPQELKAFIEYVNDGPSYDVVIDGLNVAHIDPFVNKSLQLRQVVVYFAEQLRKRVLVIGRRHMLSYRGDWQAYNMTWIKEIADCFFTDNVSHDDPFLLYATLHSGNNAVYVSRDMMRDHKALLDKQTHAYFVRWQRSHQFVPEKIRKNKPPLFQRPLLHDTRLQTDGKSWHIPIDFELSNQHWKLPNVWLCATRTK
uniref:Mitochondrial ribonuclease P protein 3-like n=1 Tax=Saccoglossus kowalevskii TaxID=10224 RepID=A0ABM0H096_SACKO|nr:PREDICTED: mitochondrial ribonuclease P protein 3-like [Saccoglossus kowalevskii]